MCVFICLWSYAFRAFHLSKFFPPFSPHPCWGNHRWTASWPASEQPCQSCKLGMTQFVVEAMLQSAPHALDITWDYLDIFRFDYLNHYLGSKSRFQTPNPGRFCHGTCWKNSSTGACVLKVMWVDQPAGVGFSTGIGTHNEQGVANNMFVSLGASNESRLLKTDQFVPVHMQKKIRDTYKNTRNSTYEQIWTDSHMCDIYIYI